MAVSISTVMPEQPYLAYDFVSQMDDHFRSVVPKVILENLRAFRRLRDSSKDTSAKYVQLTIKSLSDELKSKFMDQIQVSNLDQKRFLLLYLIFRITHSRYNIDSDFRREPLMVITQERHLNELPSSKPDLKKYFTLIGPNRLQSSLLHLFSP